MTKDEALKLALEALKQIDEAMPFPVAKLAQKVIKEALAQPEQEPTTKAGELRAMKTELWKQPEQEPVAWISATELLVMRGNALGGAKDWRVNLGLEPEEGEVGLYTTPPQGIYYTPPQRTWVGLTEDEILLISADCASSHQHTDIHFARAIEAALKAKNT